MAHMIRSAASLVRQQTFSYKAWRDRNGSPVPQNGKDFVTCPGCNRRRNHAKWSEYLYVCPDCGRNLPIGCYHRLSLILDKGSFYELNGSASGHDVLHFPCYADKLLEQKKKTGLEEAVVTAQGRIDGIEVVVCVLDGRFLMGSMGTAVGEKVTLAAEYAKEHRFPLIIFSASGGARMQEGIYSLMQMAKTSAAIASFSKAGGLFISYLTHPTTGGVTASFASLGDITLAEPGALIGFAGPRVIEQTIGRKLPKGFQRSEYLEKHGFVDQIVPRSEMKQTLSRLLRLHRGVKVS